MLNEHPQSWRQQDRPRGRCGHQRGAQGQRGAGEPRVRAYILSSLVIVVVFVALLLIRVQRGAEHPLVSHVYFYHLSTVYDVLL